jgi:hypothetical protein
MNVRRAKKRGVKDIFFLVCDGLKGLPDSVSAVFPLATVQTCIIHLFSELDARQFGARGAVTFVGGRRRAGRLCSAA